MRSLLAYSAGAKILSNNIQGDSIHIYFFLLEEKEAGILRDWHVPLTPFFL